MRVLHGLYQSLPRQSGYSIRSKYILEGQRKIGIESFAVTPPLFKEKKEYNENGISYYRTSGKLNFLLKIPVIKHIYSMKLYEKRVEELVKEKKIDIIHAHSSFFVGKPLMKVARKYKIPFVYEIRGLWEDTAVSSGHMVENGLKYNYYRKQENKVIQNADQIITISNGIKRDIEKRNIRILNDIFIIPNGAEVLKDSKKDINTELILRKKIAKPDDIILGYISSFTTMEGINYLIKSIKFLKEYDIKLILVGDGVEFDNLQNLTNLEGVSDNVIFTGRVPHDEIALYYSLIDIFIIPRINSRVTNIVTPLKPLEAMARGKAIIASDVGGLSELIINNETGLLFQSENTKDLVAKIIQLIESKKTRDRLGKEAYDWVNKNRKWNLLIKNYKEIYEKITKSRKSE